jgi:aspartate/methionine/tyrosine aminotransferase
MLRHNLELTERWLGRWPEVFSWTPPEAGSMVFVRYRLDANSSDLARWLRTEKDVFVVAGDCFRMDGFIRIGIGAEANYLEAGLARVAEGLEERYGL